MKIDIPQFKIPRFKYKKAGADLKKAFTKLSEGGFEKIFQHINQANIKKSVDTIGIDKFIQKAAILAAGSGAVTGMGGITTMLIGVPVDMANLITQQFRVTMAISYHHTGKYKFNFADFIKIVAASLKVDTRMTMTKTLIEEVAEKLMLNIGSKTAERLMPVVGAVIGGTTNYLFIKRMAGTLQEKYSPVVVIK